MHDSTMNEEPGLSSPLQYLQNRLQAFGVLTAPARPSITIPSTEVTVDIHSNSPTKVDQSETDEHTDSRAGSIDVPTVRFAVRNDSVPKTRMSFRLAHPPPATKHKHFKVRPKLLLQLQQLSDAHRPLPALDVLPSILFAPKLARRFPRILNGRAGFGPDDLVIVRSQTYNHTPTREGDAEESSDDEDWDTREMVGAICQRRGGDGTEICLSHGSSWVAYPLPNGNYEFVSYDEDGKKTRARWVRSHRRRGSVHHNTTSSPSVEDKTFKFTLLSEDARRHPVIASMDHHAISILDQYAIPTAHPTSNAPNSPAYTSSSLSSPQYSNFNEDDTAWKTLIDTDEYLRTLIIITGIWVAFSEGWSENFRFDNDANTSRSSVRANSPALGSKIATCIEGRVPTPLSFVSAKSRHAGIGMLNRSATSIDSVRPEKPGRSPQRTISTGSAFLRSHNRSTSFGNGRSPPRDKSNESFEDVNTEKPPATRRRKAKSVSAIHRTPSIEELAEPKPSNMLVDGPPTNQPYPIQQQVTRGRSSTDAGTRRRTPNPTEMVRSMSAMGGPTSKGGFGNLSRIKGIFGKKGN